VRTSHRHGTLNPHEDAVFYVGHLIGADDIGIPKAGGQSVNEVLHLVASRLRRPLYRLGRRRSLIFPWRDALELDEVRIASQKEVVVVKQQFDGLLLRRSLRQLGAMKHRRRPLEPWTTCSVARSGETKIIEYHLQELIAVGNSKSSF